MTSRASTNIPPSLRKVWQEQEQSGRAAHTPHDEGMAATGRAIVCHDTHDKDGWKMEEVEARELNQGELLVEMVASGICHTDALFGNQPADSNPLAFYPRVVGHEGSGYVKKVGPGVTVAEPGDPVLLSFAYCDECQICAAGHKTNCNSFNSENFGGPRPVFRLKGSTEDHDISGTFFGQSSFASLSVVRQCSVVNVKGLVKDKRELALFSPLGCGIQTGSGTVLNVAQPKPSDSVAIIGLGGVGLSAVMGAKLAGCKTVIGIDRIDARLQLATELGCTHTINGSTLGDKSLVDAVKDLTDGLGSHVSIDTTGAPPLMKAGIEFTRNRGKYIQVGTAPFDHTLAHIPTFEFMVSGRQWIGAIEGHSYPPEYVPSMIRWYREGNFPFDRLVKFLPADEFERGLSEMHDGTTIKPVITWSSI